MRGKNERRKPQFRAICINMRLAVNLSEYLVLYEASGLARAGWLVLAWISEQTFSLMAFGVETTSAIGIIWCSRKSICLSIAVVWMKKSTQWWPLCHIKVTDDDDVCKCSILLPWPFTTRQLKPLLGSPRCCHPWLVHNIPVSILMDQHQCYFHHSCQDSSTQLIDGPMITCTPSLHLFCSVAARNVALWLKMFQEYKKAVSSRGKPLFLECE